MIVALQTVIEWQESRFTSMVRSSASLFQLPTTVSWKVPGAPNKTYQIQSEAWDAAGNVGVSPIVSVTTKQETPKTTTRRPQPFPRLESSFDAAALFACVYFLPHRLVVVNIRNADTRWVRIRFFGTKGRNAEQR